MLNLDQYAVMGNPIAHSKSPLIHSAFARATGQSLIYNAILVAHNDFPNAIARFRSAGGKGLNITIPFKAAAYSLAEVCSERARRAGAVNTLQVLPDGRWYGDNTDGVGLVRDLTANLGISLTGMRLLILGAGGAVRGILAPLLNARPHQIFIANRTPTRAQELAIAFADLGMVTAGGYDNLFNGDEQFDLVINATSASLEGEIPPLRPECFAEGAWCYDLMYSAQPTPFLHWAMNHGAFRAEDGWGMLVEQAAEAFFLWRGIRPATAPVIRELRGIY